MGMNDMLRKMAVLLERRQDAIFSYDVSKQKEYIAKLGYPRDEIERSYFQYKCQMKFNGNGITFLLNLVSFPVAILYWFKYGKEYSAQTTIASGEYSSMAKLYLPILIKHFKINCQENGYLHMIPFINILSFAVNKVPSTGLHSIALYLFFKDFGKIFSGLPSLKNTKFFCSS